MAQNTSIEYKDIWNVYFYYNILLLGESFEWRIAICGWNEKWYIIWLNLTRVWEEIYLIPTSDLICERHNKLPSRTTFNLLGYLDFSLITAYRLYSILWYVVFMFLRKHVFLFCTRCFLSKSSPLSQKQGWGTIKLFHFMWKWLFHFSCEIKELVLFFWEVLVYIIKHHNTPQSFFFKDSPRVCISMGACQILIA